MKSPYRIRGPAKWTWAAATVLLALLWIGSGRLGTWENAADGVECTLADGALFLYRGDPSDPQRALVRCGSNFGLYMLPTWEFELNGWYAACPLWPLPLIAGVVTVNFWRSDAVSRHRSRFNLCSNCTYDRAGLAAEATCPECGSPPV